MALAKASAAEIESINSKVRATARRSAIRYRCDGDHRHTRCRAQVAANKAAVINMLLTSVKTVSKA